MKAGRLRTWICASGVILLGVLGVAGWWQMWMMRPMGAGPAGPRVQVEVFDHEWSARPVLLVGIGDSVTAGFGASPGYSYFDRLVKNPVGDAPDVAGLNLAKVFPKLVATNLSVSGSTSPQHVRAQIPKLARQSTETLGVVVITTGGNDIIHNYGRTLPAEGAMYGASYEQARPWITNFAARLELMLAKVQAAFPGGCHIFLADIYDPTDGLGDIHKAGLPAWPDGMRIHAEYNRVIADAARRVPRVHLVNIHQAFLGHGIHCRQFWRERYDQKDPHYWFHANLEDPNDRGYDALRRLFLNEMASVFRANQQDTKAP